jgi:DNA adenine methylase
MLLVMKMICTIFGNRIKELRKEMFLSQLELAQRSGIDRSQICKIEQGKVNVTLETMLKLSTAFNKKISD